ncbi:hypothetical protein M5J14_16645 [Lysinibacillus sp. OL1_EC]|uniref:hypothetical protein n=1 Tax=unclassified Lysinibacillus TaxID=2636778 RepID=UPI00103FB7BF|nr:MULTISPECIES: hypothetical protein [unclassified Lysinibacillus]MCM0626125.1 hypothetical protein [Lysinibacillus sp. OL1_EC]MCS5501534.1 hypothetical protein [Lysinibacillus sp. A4]TBV86715.1 hypothetical protein EW028_15210 [Lysinibacillus sp. OL1]UKJ43712.1 hypothetical protein L6W14_13125 [Lysinibacillus sp. ACHW1.5]WGT40909.1 hypothetical protein QH639_09090 [Lysinibacillus sp. 1 U-2021]
MQKSSIFNRIALVVLSIMVIGVLYSFIWHKERFDRPIWIQVVMTFCFLMLSINNFRLRKYAMGWVFAGVVVAFGISIFWGTTAV